MCQSWEEWLNYCSDDTNREGNKYTQKSLFTENISPENLDWLTQNYKNRLKSIQLVS